MIKIQNWLLFNYQMFTDKIIKCLLRKYILIKIYVVKFTLYCVEVYIKNFINVLHLFLIQKDSLSWRGKIIFSHFIIQIFGIWYFLPQGIAPVTPFHRNSLHELLRWFFQIICPSNFCEKVNDVCSYVVWTIYVTSLVVPWKDMMIIVESFAVC